MSTWTPETEQAVRHALVVETILSPTAKALLAAALQEIERLRKVAVKA